MTNPGHVDPGYSGHMRFTLINMGHDDYPLIRGNPIATLLIFELSGPATKDYRARRPTPTVIPSEPAIPELSRDFIDYERRSREVAIDEIRKAGIRAEAGRVWIPALAALAGAVIAGFFSVWAPLRNKVDTSDLVATRERIQTLERSVEELKKVPERFTALSTDLADLRVRADTAKTFEERLNRVEEQMELSN